MPYLWVLVDLLTRKIKLRCTKSTVLDVLALSNGKDPDTFKQSDPDQIEKQDLDTYQKGLDPQHWFKTNKYRSFYHQNYTK
jgi:hypothetical protein